MNSSVVNRPQQNVPFLLRKITPRDVTQALGQIDLLTLQRPIESRILYEIYGHARTATVIQDKTGTKKDSVRFAGEFKAITPDEYVFESGRCFIPVLEEYLYSALKSAQEQEPGAYLEFAFSIGIDPAPPGKPSMTGYEFNVQRLIQSAPKKDDPIARLMAEAKEHKLRLAAPKDPVAPGVGGTSAAADISTGTSSATPSSMASSSETKSHRSRASAGT